MSVTQTRLARTKTPAYPDGQYIRALFDFTRQRPSDPGGTNVHFGDVFRLLDTTQSASSWTVERIAPSPSDVLEAFGESDDLLEETTAIPSERWLQSNLPGGLYEMVTPKNLPYVRPVLIIGPFKDRLTTYLLEHQPHNYAIAVAHTSRVAQHGELHGIDYYFVTRAVIEGLRDSGAFVDLGMFNEQLYGTTEGSIREVAQRQRKRCLLDLSIESVTRLIQRGLHPIIIIVKPDSVDQLRNSDAAYAISGVAEAEYMNAVVAHRQLADRVTATVSGQSFDRVLRQVDTLIRVHSTDDVLWSRVHTNVQST